MNVFVGWEFRRVMRSLMVAWSRSVLVNWGNALLGNHQSWSMIWVCPVPLMQMIWHK